MIFETLYEHAKVLVDQGFVGETAFVLEKIRIDTQELVDRIEKSKDKGKVIIPLVLHGHEETQSVSRLKISNAGNASKNTFQGLKNEELPPDWFPWPRNSNIMCFSDFLVLLERVNQASYDQLASLFLKGCPLDTFENIPPEELDKIAAQTICLPVSCKSPKGFSHVILGLNALLNYSSEMQSSSLEMKEEFWRFALLFWILDRAEKSLNIITDDKKELKIAGVSVIGGGVLGENIGALPLIIRLDSLTVGAKITNTTQDSPVLSHWAKLAVEDDPGTITLGNRTYSSPATGISPTNACENQKGENVLISDVRKGFDTDKVLPILEGYTPLLMDTAFYLDNNLFYYIFPETSVEIKEYLEYLRTVLSNLGECKRKYFKIYKSKDKHREEKIKEVLKRINREHCEFWDNLQDSFCVNSLTFSFEENVGSANQSQFAWTSVYQEQSVQRIFLLLYLLNMPYEFGPISEMLNYASQDMGANWTAREKRYLIDNFMCRRYLDTNEYWLRWRKYLTRKDLSQNPIKPEVWERSMALVMSLQFVDSIAGNVQLDWDGNRLFEEFDRGRFKMKESRQEIIFEYLKLLFRHDNMAQDENSKNVNSMLKRCSKEYSEFVDTDSNHWESIVDGLICGWGLNRLCYRLREHDPKSVIGGRSLIKRQPQEVRTLMIDLIEKAQRGGKSVWLIEQPLEILFNLADRTTMDKEVRLFMDALAFGFIRYNKFSAKAEVTDKEVQK